MDDGRFSISPDALYQRLGTATAPVVVDVRRAPAYDADERVIIGATRCPPEEIAQWARTRAPGNAVVAYCVHGHEVSQGATERLRDLGLEAQFLAGGVSAWVERGLPTRRKSPPASPQWVTRERPKIDRIACPWLIRRFIDRDASFLFVPTEQVFAVAAETGAVAFDIPGAEPFSHDGEFCSFDAFLKIYDIQDPALEALSPIVRGADTARLELAPQSSGLLALSLGLSANYPDDHEMLGHGMIMYDALYAWCRSLQGETHNWTPPTQA